ncbi:MAG: KH domain-containing protein [Candidatus Zixiibacteriota bacterium]|nr:MAG: KH domain-containing protein [candidate division Zixibacteria bacterium]
MKEFVEFIARHLVEHPDEVEVKEIESTRSTIIELRVNPSDLGKVIGKNGQTAKALRTLLTAASARIGKRAALEILD